ncbi:hypothetical protein DFH09DRAFT_1072455 [Mycena vulgaris]|nr:hypothetical protein DFH09DRAFT_1072455 [Mycena vulgaris]
MPDRRSPLNPAPRSERRDSHPLKPHHHPSPWPRMRGINLAYSQQRGYTDVDSYRAHLGKRTSHLFITLTEGCLYDRDIIAKEIGFRDGEEELEYLAASAQGLEPEGEWKAPRHDFVDVETLDYAFLTDILVVRLRKSADGIKFWFELFEIQREPTYSVTPVLLKLDVAWWSDYPELTEAALIAENSGADLGCLSMWIQSSYVARHSSVYISYSSFPCSGKYSLSVMDVAKLIECLSNPSLLAEVIDPMDLVCYHSQGSQAGAPFWTTNQEGIRSMATRKILLFPALDLDPTSPDPTTPLIRFLRFGKVGNPVQTTDIPISTLIPTDELLRGFRDQLSLVSPPPFVLSWDGRSRLCIIFRQTGVCLEDDEPHPRAWFVTLGSEILARIGGEG